VTLGVELSRDSTTILEPKGKVIEKGERVDNYDAAALKKRGTQRYKNWEILWGTC